jgi:succinate dehydrogenase / fumarate reductase, membrane anchor subunit
MIDKATIANPKTRYGDARHATREFKTQRLTGMFNVLFAIFFVWFVVRLAGADRGEMVEVVRNPFVALGVVLLIVNVSVHMRIGMHEVIMDYLDEGKQNRLAVIANNVFAVVVPAVTILAVAKIVFWG